MLEKHQKGPSRQATGQHHMHTPAFGCSQEGGGHLCHSLVLCPSQPATPLSEESSSGTVMSQTMCSGENHATRSLLLKTKIGARQVGRKDGAKTHTATVFSWGRGRCGQVQEQVKQKEALSSFGANFRKWHPLHFTPVTKNNLEGSSLTAQD